MIGPETSEGSDGSGQKVPFRFVWSGRRGLRRSRQLHLCCGHAPVSAYCPQQPTAFRMCTRLSSEGFRRCLEM